MTQLSKIEVPVEAATAAALSTPQRLEAVGRLIDRLVRPGLDDPLTNLLEQTAAEARAMKLGEIDIATELAAYNAERRR